MIRREFINCAMWMGLEVATAVAHPIRSNIASRMILENSHSDSYTPVPALKIVGANYPTRTYIDSGIVVPPSGDFYVESDFVFFETVAGRETEPYWTIGGVSPFASPYGFGTNNHVGWRINIYYSGGKEKIRFDSATNIRNGHYSVRYGIIDDMEYFDVNGVVKTNPLDGTERGNGLATFMFFASYPWYQNRTGTILGEVRLFHGSEKVFNGIPCIRDKDGACGYFDTVDGRFCPAVGNIGVWYGEVP